MKQKKYTFFAFSFLALPLMLTYGLIVSHAENLPDSSLPPKLSVTAPLTEVPFQVVQASDMSESIAAKYIDKIRIQKQTETYLVELSLKQDPSLNIDQKHVLFYSYDEAGNQVQMKKEGSYTQTFETSDISKPLVLNMQYSEDTSQGVSHDFRLFIDSSQLPKEPTVKYGSVTKHYLNQKKEVIQTTEKITGIVGDAYAKPPVEIKGKDGNVYSLDTLHLPAEDKGVFIDGDLDLNYLYTLKEQPVSKTETIQSATVKISSSDVGQSKLIQSYFARRATVKTKDGMNEVSIELVDSHYVRDKDLQFYCFDKSGNRQSISFDKRTDKNWFLTFDMMDANTAISLSVTDNSNLLPRDFQLTLSNWQDGAAPILAHAQTAPSTEVESSEDVQQPPAVNSASDSSSNQETPNSYHVNKQPQYEASVIIQPKNESSQVGNFIQNIASIKKKGSGYEVFIPLKDRQLLKQKALKFSFYDLKGKKKYMNYIQKQDGTVAVVLYMENLAKTVQLNVTYLGVNAKQLVNEDFVIQLMQLKDLKTGKIIDINQVAGGETISSADVKENSQSKQDGTNKNKKETIKVKQIHKKKESVKERANQLPWILVVVGILVGGICYHRKRK